MSGVRGHKVKNGKSNSIYIYMHTCVINKIYLFKYNLFIHSNEEHLFQGRPGQDRQQEIQKTVTNDTFTKKEVHVVNFVTNVLRCTCVHAPKIMKTDCHTT